MDRSSQRSRRYKPHEIDHDTESGRDARALAAMRRNSRAGADAADLSRELLQTTRRRNVTIVDPDLHRARQTLVLVEMLQRGLELQEALSVHVDHIAEAHGTTGVNIGTAVHLHREFDPSSRDGRALLGHEFAHLAQRSVAGPVTPAAAEFEAHHVGDMFAQGMMVKRPSQAVAHGPARNSDAHIDKLLASPKPCALEVKFWGLRFLPKAGTTWVAGVSKELQATAVVVHALVGKKYTAALAREAYAFTKSSGTTYTGRLSGNAVQSEKMQEFTVKPVPARQLIGWLRDTKKLKLVVDTTRLKKLEIGQGIQEAWAVMKHAKPPLYGWFNESLFWARLASKQHVEHVLTFRKHVEAWKANEQDPATIARMRESVNTISKVLREDTKLIELIRADPSLTDHPLYRGLWHLPGVDPAAPTKMAPVGPDSAVRHNLAGAILFQSNTNKAAGRKALGTGPNASAARRAIMDGVFGVMKEHGLDTQYSGDSKLVDLASRSNAPPVPSRLQAYPQLAPPFFDKASGAAHDFAMRLTYPTDLEAVAAHFVNRFMWEVIEIPSGKLGDLVKAAQDQQTNGQHPSWGDVFDVRLNRQAQYWDEDRKELATAMGGLEAVLGPVGYGADTVAAVARTLATVGTVLQTVIEMLTKPQSERKVAFDKPGLYVVRCSVQAKASDNAQYLRAPSVAWLPVWVRDPKTMADRRMELQLRSRGASEARIQAILKELKRKDLKPKEKEALRTELKALRVGLYGTVEQLLQQERSALVKQQASLPAEIAKASGPQKTSLAHRLTQIGKRIKEIDEILRIRTGRHQGVVKAGYEGPVRIPAVFVGDTGRSMNLALEVLQLSPKSTTQWKYRVTDATTKMSSMLDGPVATNREDAIAFAVRDLLKKPSGYGRGYVTLHIPAQGAKIASPDKDANVTSLMRQIRINASAGAIALEAADGLATIISVAAIAAAPFTGGSSLSLMVPAGLIGAVPSTYRLIDRGSTGTLSMDLAAAMDIVNIIGGVAGFGQATAGLKVAWAGKGLMMIGLGTDGLGIALAGAGFVEAAKNIDPNAPASVRRAMLMQLVGQQLVTLGMMVGASLARKGVQAKAQALAGGPDAGTVSRSPKALQEAFAKQAGQDVPIYESTKLKGDSVEVHYDLDGYGLPTNIRVLKAKGASDTVVLAHAKTVKTIGKFQGLQGRLRTLLDRVTRLFTGKTSAKVGSRAWEAKLELEKLPRVIRGYIEDVKAGRLDPAKAAQKIADIETQMKRWETALNDSSAGRGVVASRDVTAQAKATGYPEPPADHFYVAKPDGGFQLERLANSDVVPMQVYKRGGQWKFREKPIARSKAPTSDTTTAAMGDLQTAHPKHTFSRPVTGGERISVNGVELHPDFITKLKTEGTWDAVLEATQALKKKSGRFDRLSPEHQATLKNAGVKNQSADAKQGAFQVVRTALESLQLYVGGKFKSAQAKTLFGKISDFDVGALVRLKNVGHLKGSALTQAVKYALSKNPHNIGDFVALCEQWGHTMLARAKALEVEFGSEVTKAVRAAQEKAPPGTKVKRGPIETSVREAFFGQATSGQPVGGERSPKTLARRRAGWELENAPADVDAYYQPHRSQVGGRYGGTQLGVDYHSPDLVRTVQQRGANFGSEAKAVYHAEKHWKELPISERTESGAQKATEYLRSARTTIQHPTSVDGPTMVNGAMCIKFKRTIPAAKNGGSKEREMTAIVYVRPDGTALLATYGGRTPK